MTKIVNGVPYEVDIVPQSKWSIKCPYPMAAKKVTLHNTDNEMPAKNEASYHHSNNNQVSFHLVADEKEVRQLLPFNRNGWHSGDGGNGYGNRNTIAMEIARNYDRKRKTTNLLEPLQGFYTKAEQNAIKALAQVMITEGIVANNENIKTHNDWNGKWCPSKILNEGRLQQVKNGIIAEYNRLKGLPAPKPVAPTSKVDGHLSLSQIVDKTIAGGYGSQPQREKNIYSKTNFSYKQVQDAVNAKIRQAAAPKPAPVAPKPVPAQAWTGQVLRQGDRGDAVRQLQTMLAKKYFYPEKGARNNGVDGFYGKNTKDAVRRFQSVNGLKTDGIAGPATYRKLK